MPEVLSTQNSKLSFTDIRNNFRIIRSYLPQEQDKEADVWVQKLGVKETIVEACELLKSGVTLDKLNKCIPLTCIPLSFHSFTCDAPARSFLKRVIVITGTVVANVVIYEVEK